jgi:hypothetical protein
MRKELIEASRLHYRAHIEKHRINVEVMLQKPLAVAEHADIMDAIEREIALIAEYHDKLEVLETYFANKE